MESDLEKQPVAENPGPALASVGTASTLDVINTLAAQDISSCVIGANALVYYGAHRVPMICVPTESFERAKGMLLTSIPTDSDEPKYEASHPVMPQPGSLDQTYPRFTLQGVNFFFILVPTYDCLIDCDPERCEHSPSGIPYPKLEHFAQALLDRQQDADLADLVDGMDLDEAWGERHLQFDKPPAVEYITGKNDLIVRTFPESMSGGAVFAMLTEKPRPRHVWLRIVGSKERRIDAELQRDRYLTRFWKVGSGDPREDGDREV